MNRHHIREIPLIMCESCMDIIIEDNSWELRGMSYCCHCADKEVQP